MNSGTLVELPAISEPLSPPEEHRRYEFLEGEWVVKKMGTKSSRIGMILSSDLNVYAETHQAGFVMNPECGYQVFPHAPKLVRFPDVSFVRRGRLPNEELPDGYMVIPPDLAVEVVSPNDLAEELEQRIHDYLRVGVPLIWIIYPKARRVHVLRPDGSAQHLGESDTMQGEDVLPGFTLPVKRLFAF